jgi:DNA-binding NtrC family response regulator
MTTEILVADDQIEVLDMLIRSLQDDTRTVQAFSTGREALAHLKQNPDAIGLAILDLDYGPDEPDGLEILPQMLEIIPDLPIIMLTGQGTVDTAVAALRLGATDFIEKDFYIEDKIELSLEKLERVHQALRENARLRAEVQDLDRENQFYRGEFGKRYQVIGTSHRLQQILQQARTVASIPRPAFILGEPGTGKELVAAAIHYGGNRKDRPFVKVNCAALADQLLESELFGHEKGAYTGATEARQGKFEAASGGTIFLDEIGNTTPEFQQNILRAIEYKEIQRVGSAEPLSVDVRVIAATNADLEKEIAEGRFRQDLYDRLRFEVLRIPPLRERREDVPELADYFVEQIVQEVPGLKKRGFSDQAMEYLMTYRWPGNVRELKFAAERAACVAQGPTIEPGDLPPEISQQMPLSPASGDGFEAQMHAFELGLLRRVLNEASWNQREAAKQLKLSYDQFRHLYRKYKLNEEQP